MTDTFALSDAPGAGTDRPAAERGTLDVRAKAVEQIVCNAALQVPGSVVHTAGITQLGQLGTMSLPSASVTFRGAIATATLDIAATWPCAAQQLAADVRDTVRVEASRLSGTDITRVDVTLHIVPSAGDAVHQSPRPRRVQ